MKNYKKIKRFENIEYQQYKDILNKMREIKMEKEN